MSQNIQGCWLMYVPGKCHFWWPLNNVYRNTIYRTIFVFVSYKNYAESRRLPLKEAGLRNTVFCRPYLRIRYGIRDTVRERKNWSGRERRGLAARAPRHSSPARTQRASAALISFSGYFFISSYRMAYMSYIEYRMGIYGRQNTVCRNPGFRV